MSVILPSLVGVMTAFASGVQESTDDRLLDALRRRPAAGPLLERWVAEVSVEPGFEAAMQTLEAAADPASLFVRALALDHAGEDERALSALESLPDEVRSSFDGWRARSAVQLDLGQRPDALTSLEHAFDLGDAAQQAEIARQADGIARTVDSRARVTALWTRLSERNDLDRYTLADVADALRSDEQTELSRRTWKRVLDRATDDPPLAYRARLALIELEFATGDGDVALRDALRLLASVDSTSWQATQVWTTLEASLRERGEVDTLCRLLQRRADEADDRVARRRLAELLTHEGRWEEAIAAMEAALRDAPGDGTMRDAQITLWARMERWDDALNAARAWVQLAPRLATPRLRLASLALRRIGNESAVDEALNAWNGLIADDDAPLRHLLLVAGEAGRERTRPTLDPDSSDRLRAFSELQWRRAVATFPDQLDAHEAWARALDRWDRADEAVAAIRAMVDGPSAGIAAWQLAHDLHRDGERPRDALECLIAALTLTPDDRRLRERTVRAALDLELWPVAEEHLIELEARLSSLAAAPTSLELRTEWVVGSETLDGEVFRLEQELSAGTLSPRDRWLLSKLYACLGDADRSFVTLERLAELHPDVYPVALEWARQLAGRPRASGVEGAYRDLIQRFPEQRRAVSQELAAWFLEVDRPGESWDVFQSLLTETPDDTALCQAAADVAAKLGRVDDAVRLLRRTLPASNAPWELRTRIALLLAGQKELPRAIAELETALRDVVDRDDALQVAEVLARLASTNDDLLIGRLRRQAERTQREADAVALAFQLLHRGRLNDAALTLEAFLGRTPEAHATRQWLTSLYEQANQLVDAERHFAILVDQRPDDADSRRRLEDVRTRLDQKAAAERAWQSITDGTSNWTLREHLVKALNQEYDAKADVLFQRAEENGALDASLLELRMTYRMRSQDFEAAMADALTLLAMTPPEEAPPASTLPPPPPATSPTSLEVDHAWYGFERSIFVEGREVLWAQGARGTIGASRQQTQFPFGREPTVRWTSLPSFVGLEHAMASGAPVRRWSRVRASGPLPTTTAASSYDEVGRNGFLRSQLAAAACIRFRVATVTGGEWTEHLFSSVESPHARRAAVLVEYSHRQTMRAVNLATEGGEATADLLHALTLERLDDMASARSPTRPTDEFAEQCITSARALAARWPDARSVLAIKLGQRSQFWTQPILAHAALELAIDGGHSLDQLLPLGPSASLCGDDALATAYFDLLWQTADEHPTLRPSQQSRLAWITLFHDRERSAARIVPYLLRQLATPAPASSAQDVRLAAAMARDRGFELYDFFWPCPTSSFSAETMALLYEVHRQSATDDARAELFRAVSDITPSTATSEQALVALDVWEGRGDEALQRFEALSERPDADASMRLAWSHGLLATGRPMQALESLAEVTYDDAQLRTRAILLTRHIQRTMLQGDLAACVTWLRSCLAHDAPLDLSAFTPSRTNVRAQEEIDRHLLWLGRQADRSDSARHRSVSLALDEPICTHPLDELVRTAKKVGLLDELRHLADARPEQDDVPLLALRALLAWEAGDEVAALSAADRWYARAHPERTDGERTETEWIIEAALQHGSSAEWGTTLATDLIADTFYAREPELRERVFASVCRARLAGPGAAGETLGDALVGSVWDAVDLGLRGGSARSRDLQRMNELLRLLESAPIDTRAPLLPYALELITSTALEHDARATLTRRIPPLVIPALAQWTDAAAQRVQASLERLLFPDGLDAPADLSSSDLDLDLRHPFLVPLLVLARQHGTLDGLRERWRVHPEADAPSGRSLRALAAVAAAEDGLATEFPGVEIDPTPFTWVRDLDDYTDLCARLARAEHAFAESDDSAVRGVASLRAALATLELGDEDDAAARVQRVFPLARDDFDAQAMEYFLATGGEEAGRLLLDLLYAGEEPSRRALLGAAHFRAGDLVRALRYLDPLAEDPAVPAVALPFLALARAAQGRENAAEPLELARRRLTGRELSSELGALLEEARRAVTDG